MENFELETSISLLKCQTRPRLIDIRLLKSISHELDPEMFFHLLNKFVGKRIHQISIASLLRSGINLLPEILQTHHGLMIDELDHGVWGVEHLDAAVVLEDYFKTADEVSIEHFAGDVLTYFSKYMDTRPYIDRLAAEGYVVSNQISVQTWLENLANYGLGNGNLSKKTIENINLQTREHGNDWPLELSNDDGIGEEFLEQIKTGNLKYKQLHPF